ncbi:MAG TPA: glycosyltransferase family 2 protein [Gemmatimonadales bacterium]|nr:glycosyltransferase family 2 protein [Gemmatimonadales bacterium]
MSDALRVSVAIPLFNEERGVDELLRRVNEVLDRVPGGPHEIVCVNDGSTDGTLAALERAVATNPRLVVVALSRNFGHQTALTAALEYVTGDVTVVMDGDLQDPPEVIPTFLDHFRRGYDVVYAQRVGRQESWWLRTSYFLFYRLLARLSSIALPLDAGDFSLMSRRVVEGLRSAPERNRYLRGLRTWIGFRQLGVPVPRPERYAGSSHYSVWALLRLAFDGIFAFSIVPLRAAAILGAGAIAASGLYVFWALYAKFILRESPQGFTTLIVAIIFLSGVNLLFLGIVGEYVGRVYEEVKRRPLYVVDNVRRGTGSGT